MLPDVQSSAFNLSTRSFAFDAIFGALSADVRHAFVQSWIAMEDVDGDVALADELRQRQQHDNIQVVQPSNIAATFDLDAAEAPLQALFTNVSLARPLHLHQACISPCLFSYIKPASVLVVAHEAGTCRATLFINSLLLSDKGCRDLLCNMLS